MITLLLPRAGCGVLTTLALACLIIAPVCRSAGQSTKPAKGTFRVMTYNIHHGEGLDGKVDLQRIADLIQREQADVVALQEVDKGTQRTQRRDFPAELARLTGLSCLFSNNLSYQGGEYGNAVLSRFPVKSCANLHFKMLKPGEQRGLLQAVLEVHGRELVLMTTHLDQRSPDDERWSCVQEIETRAAEYTGKPIIVCGDFNTGPDSRVYARLNASFRDTWKLVGAGQGLTIPAEQPRCRIDYIWISQDKSLVPVRAWVPKSEASDHLPVVAEFELR